MWTSQITRRCRVNSMLCYAYRVTQSLVGDRKVHPAWSLITETQHLPSRGCRIPRLALCEGTVDRTE